MANVLVAVSFIPSSRDGRHAYHGGNRFKVNREKNDVLYWRCTKKGCGGTTQTTDDRLLKIGTAAHNHQPSPHLYDVDMFKARFLERARTETTPIPRIYDNELSTVRKNNHLLPNDFIQHIPTLDTMRSPMYRERQKTIPKLPTSRSAIQLEGDWTLTDAGEPFLIADHGDIDKIIIFTTRQNLEYLCEANIIYADGTFYSFPKLFLQIYTIHSKVRGLMYPLVYFLLPNKNEATYTTAFQLLKNETERLGLNLQPDIFQIDFEKAAANAAISTFDRVQIRGCYFHFAQALWRKIQYLGLVNRYKGDPDFHRLASRAKSLPLAPLDQVDNVWLDAIAESPDDDQVPKFMDYITTTWVEEGVWEKLVWNYFANDGHRTNNNIEGNKINSLTTYHPNIYEFVGSSPGLKLG